MEKGNLKVLLAAAILLASVGCGGGGSPAKPPAKGPKTPAPAAKQEKSAEGKVEQVEVKKEEVEASRYLPGNRRDPFRSLLVTTEEAKALENLPPLQRTDLEDLRLIGVVWGEFGYSAMIQTPDGKGYTVRPGTLMGPNRGKVIKITKRYVSVQERYTDIFGERKTRVVKLDLYPQKEGTE